MVRGLQAGRNMEPCRFPAAVASSILVVLLSSKSGAVTFEATNAAANTTGGKRFNKEIGLDYAKKVLSDASNLIWNTFNQQSPADRKPVNSVTLVVDDEGAGMVAFTSNGSIHLSAQYIGSYSGDALSEVTGTLYHETTHIWQWFGGKAGVANPALIEGIADFIQLKAGWYDASWVRERQLERWDQGYEVTARFLDYCNSLTPGFIAELNAKMKDDYTDDFFAQITGKTVQQLWQNFVQTYNSTDPGSHNGSVPGGAGTNTPGRNNSIPSARVPRENGTYSISRRKSSKRLILLIAVPVGITLCLISSITIFALRGTTRSRQKTLTCTTYSEDIEEIQALLLDPILIRAATDNFDEANKLGEGGFGQVYKGLLPDGLEIAVKRLAKESKQGICELKNELVLVAKLQHRNLVKLLGACLHEEEKLLVYEYIPNKSLDAFIFDEEKRKNLTWEIRYEIICGIARGMVYLHDESRVKVIHRDLKPSNILLEEDMSPKICDFGLARIFERDNTKDVTRRVAGTYGYMAPEYAVLGHISTKSDVFSFGVIILEIVAGRRNTTSSEGMMAEHLLSYVWENWTRGTVPDVVDTYLNRNCAENEVLKCIHIGLLCVQENPSDRPRMSDVILMLVGRSTTLPAPSRPAFLFSLDDANRVHPGGANEVPERSNRCNLSFNKVTITEFEPR